MFYGFLGLNLLLYFFIWLGWKNYQSVHIKKENATLNFFAKWAKIFVLLLPFGIFSPMSLYAGFKAWFDIRKNGGKGKGWAISAIITGLYVLAVIAIQSEEIFRGDTLLFLPLIALMNLVLYFIMRNNTSNPESKNRKELPPLSSKLLWLFFLTVTISLMYFTFGLYAFLAGGFDAFMSSLRLAHLGLGPMLLMNSIKMLSNIPMERRNMRVFSWISLVAGIIGTLGMLFLYYTIFISPGFYGAGIMSFYGLFYGLIMILTLALSQWAFNFGNDNPRS